MDSTSRILLDRVQRSFPIVSEPFAALCEGLDLDEDRVRSLIGSLKREKAIRQISAIFNTGALGYRSSLVAMAVPENRLDEACEVVNRYPGVSHNYLRPGDFNMWFTIAVPAGRNLDEVVSELALQAGGWRALILPAQKKYKLAVVLDMLEEGDNEGSDEKSGAPFTEAIGSASLTPENIRIVKCIQEDLPLVRRPFALWGESLGMSESKLLETISGWLSSGIIRRFAAILNHRRVGFHANGMVVWDCPEDRIDALGQILASHAEVSHCYHRPGYPEWPYNLYAMIHGRTPSECEAVAGKLARAIALDDFRILFSTREFKKIRLKLFWD